MTFYDWIYSNYPPDSIIDGRYKLPHILTILFLVAAAVVLSFVFCHKSEKQRYVLIFIISMLILFFEITRRIINLTRYDSYSLNEVIHILLPRPWCAISCWFMIFAPIVKKRFIYNFTACNGIVCALVFFAYPSVGFNHSVILFENLYSIATHTLLLLGSILYITLRFTKFEYYGGSLRKSAIWELGTLIIVFVYAFVEIYLLKIELDPLYFLRDNDVQKFLGCSYPVYLLIYSSFLILYFNLFYLIDGYVRKKIAQKNA